MRRARTYLRAFPALLRIIIRQLVAKRGRGDENAMRRLKHCIGKGHRRIAPVAMKACVDLAPEKSLDGEPVHKHVRRLRTYAFQHGLP